MELQCETYLILNILEFKDGKMPSIKKKKKLLFKYILYIHSVED